jgi:hypothetical protein
MFVYTVTIRKIGCGSLPIPEIECPNCKAKKLSMEFYNTESSSFAWVFRSPHACGDVVCQHCAHEIPYEKFDKPLRQFHKGHSAQFHCPFSFRFTKGFKVAMLGMLAICVFGYFKVRHDKANASERESTQTALKQQEKAKRTIGAYYLVHEMADDGKGNMKLQAVWLKLVKIDGDNMVFAKHRDRVDFVTAANKIPKVDRDNFTTEEVAYSLQKSTEDVLIKGDGGNADAFSKIELIEMP